MLDFLHQEQNPDTGRIMRKVRSFVLREGRLTVGQARALEQLWPTLGIERSQGRLESTRFFDNDQPMVLEIGYGMGQSLVAMALAEPCKNFVGIEVHRPGVGALLMAIDEGKVPNLRTYCDDAVDVLEQCVPDGSLARVQLYFPDPWHKKKHHKRRIVQSEWVALVQRKLASGGVLHMATDWENYAEHMMDVMKAASGWNNLAESGDFAPRPDFRPETKFERRGARLGHGVWDLLFEKA